MSRERILAIALDVQEALDRAPEWCATFEAKDDEEKWVQFVDGVINAAYPDPVAPDKRTKPLPGFEMTEWSRGKFMTGKMQLTDRTEIARWIDRYFVDVLRCEPGFAIFSRLEKL
jgi:hypothetical protein